MEGLSNKIRERRFRSNEMTQKELANRVGVSRQTLNAIENCRRAPTITVAIRIADVFGLSVDALFNFNYDGKPAGRVIASDADAARPEAVIEPVVE